MPTIQVADKPTLDNVYEQLQHKGQYIGAKELVNVPYELPYDFYHGCAVIYKDEIHILGGDYSALNASSYFHYKFDGNSWTFVSILPYAFDNGSAVVYNDEIHILGSSATSDVYTRHYAWNGKEWRQESELPYNFAGGDAVVYEDTIHIFGSSIGSSNYKSHMVYLSEIGGSGGVVSSAWLASGQSLDYNFYNGCVVVYNGYIHVLGGTGNKTAFRKLGDSGWETLTNIPMNFYNGSAVVHDGKIYIFGSGESSYDKWCYTWNGEKWIYLNTLLPYSFADGSVIEYKNQIHILGSSKGTSSTNHSYSCYHYKFNDDTQVWEDNLIYRLPNYCSEPVILFNNEFYYINAGDKRIFKHNPFASDYIWTKEPVELPKDGSWGNSVSEAVVTYNRHSDEKDSIHILSNSIGYSNYTHLIYDPVDKTLTIGDVIPYTFTKGAAVFDNNKMHIFGSGSLSGYEYNHYMWSVADGWTQAEPLPMRFYDGDAVAIGNDIYIFEYTSFCKYNFFEGGWETEVNDAGETVPKIWNNLPVSFQSGAAIEFNNEIHIFQDTYHYKLNLSDFTWTYVSHLPVSSFYKGSAIVLDNEIHIFHDTTHAKFNQENNEWIVFNDLRYEYMNYFLPKGAVITFNSDNSIVEGDVTYNSDTKTYTVNSTGLVKIEVSEEKNKIYTIT